MKVSQLWQADKKSKLKRRVALIVPTLMLAVSLAFVTIYSANVGNTTLKVDRNSRKHIQIGKVLKDGEIEDATTILWVNSNKKSFSPTTYQAILPEIENVHNAEGLYEKDGFDALSYSFYLGNKNNESTIDVDYSIVLEGSTKKIESAIRILLIRNGEEKVYQKKETIRNDALPYYPDSDFIENDSRKRIIKETILGLKKDEVVKFSIIVWVDFSDPDATEEMLKDAGLKFSVIFRIRDET